MNRRSPLIKAMTDLENQNISCKDCTGRCCTYQANSMQMTALETEELYSYLTEKNLWNSELETRLQECITEFRLDKEITTGKNTSFRRSYTCPFFKHESLGCPLPPEVKPYGCLAFNALSNGVKDGEDCASDLDLLEERESKEEEDENVKLKEQRHYYWDKLPIPMALLERRKVSK